MHNLRRSFGVAVLAITVFLAGGLGVWRTTKPAPGIAAPLPTDGLGAVAAPAASIEQAIANLQARIAADPSDAHSLASLGLAYSQEAVRTADPSYYPRAEEALRRSLALQPDDNAEALIGMGIISLARHDFTGGVQWGRRALQLSPDAAHVLGVIGDGQLELGRYRRAFATFATMVRSRPDIASYARVSYARELQGNIAGALEAMQLAEQAAGTPQDAAWVSHQIGELYFRSGRLNRAERAYGRSVALSPTFVPGRAGLAKLAWARGRIDQAIRGYRWVVARYPLPEHVIALGDLYAIDGRPRRSSDEYELARAEAELFRANGVNVDVELALFEADHGDPEAALADARAGWRSRRSIHAADALAWALYRNGRYQQAAQLERLALRLGTQDASYFFHAGMIARRLGQVNSAEHLLMRARAINPNFSILYADQARRVLGRLNAEGTSAPSSRP